MQEFWAEDFPPVSQPIAAAAWTLSSLWRVFAHFLVFFPPDNPVLAFIVALPLILAVVGMVVAVRRRQLDIALLLAPPAAGLAAAFAHLLPFDPRVGLRRDHGPYPDIRFLERNHAGRNSFPR